MKPFIEPAFFGKYEYCVSERLVTVLCSHLLGKSLPILGARRERALTVQECSFTETTHDPL